MMFFDEPSSSEHKWLARLRMVFDRLDLKKSMTSVIIGTPVKSSTNVLALLRSAMDVCQCAMYLEKGFDCDPRKKIRSLLFEREAVATRSPWMNGAKENSGSKASNIEESSSMKAPGNARHLFAMSSCKGARAWISAGIAALISLRPPAGVEELFRILGSYKAARQGPLPWPRRRMRRTRLLLRFIGTATTNFFWYTK